MTCLTEPDFLRLPPRPFCIPMPPHSPRPACIPKPIFPFAGKLYPPGEMKPPKLEVLLAPVLTELPPSAPKPMTALIANPEGAS